MFSKGKTTVVLQMAKRRMNKISSKMSSSLSTGNYRGGSYSLGSLFFCHLSGSGIIIFHLTVSTIIFFSMVTPLESGERFFSIN